MVNDSKLSPTKLLYLEDTYLGESEAEVVGLEKINDEENKWSVFLDKTVFYPQGGGQCYDQGWLRYMAENEACVELRVESVFFDRNTGVVSHNVSILDGMMLPKVGSRVEMSIDMDRRLLMSSYHSAGHMIDLIGARGELPGLDRAFKGDHNPEGAYVKFDKVIDINDKDKLIAEIQDAVDRLSSEALNIISIEHSDVKEGAPEGKTYREVYFEGYSEKKVGCGGTHISNTSKVGKVNILDVRSRKGATTVKYNVEV
jgi:alanyl-tRNA synthetase